MNNFFFDKFDLTVEACGDGSVKMILVKVEKSLEMV